MESINWLGVISAFFGVLAFLWTVIKYAIDKHTKSVHEKITENKQEVTEKIKTLTQGQRENELANNSLRDDMHAYYVRKEDMHRDMSEIKGIMKSMFDKFDEFGANLNQLIGQQKRDTDG